MGSRLAYTPEHHQFRQLVCDFVQQTVVPVHENWERAGCWDRSLFTQAGKLGLLGFPVPEQFGGPGVHDFRYQRSSSKNFSEPGPRLRPSPSRCKTTSCCPISPI